jgi:hypothetical protein
MSRLTREAILSVDDRRTETFHVDEWGGEVTIRMMSGEQREDLEIKIANREKNGLAGRRIRALAVVYSLVDERGQPLFTTKDVDALAEKSGTALDKILERIIALNGMNNAEAEAIAKN